MHTEPSRIRNSNLALERTARHQEINFVSIKPIKHRTDRRLFLSVFSLFIGDLEIQLSRNSGRDRSRYSDRSLYPIASEFLSRLRSLEIGWARSEQNKRTSRALVACYEDKGETRTIRAGILRARCIETEKPERIEGYQMPQYGVGDLSSLIRPIVLANSLRTNVVPN